MKKELAESTLRSQETNLFVPLLFCFQILCTLTPIGLLRMNSGRTGGKAIVFIISILFFGCLCYYFMPPGPHARVKACGRPQVGMNSFHAVLHVPLCECNLAQYAKPQQLF